jgi:hypothetical protein
MIMTYVIPLMHKELSITFLENYGAHVLLVASHILLGTSFKYIQLFIKRKPKYKYLFYVTFYSYLENELKYDCICESFFLHVNLIMWLSMRNSEHHLKC